MVEPPSQTICNLQVKTALLATVDVVTKGGGTGGGALAPPILDLHTRTLCADNRLLCSLSRLCSAATGGNHTVISQSLKFSYLLYTLFQCTNMREVI